MSKAFYGGPLASKAKYIYKLSSMKLGRLIRLTSGHNHLNYFRSKLDPSISPLCRLCEEEDETFIHWITECPVLRGNRTKIFQVATNNYVLIPNEWNLQNILDFSFIPNLEQIINTGESFREASAELGPDYTREPD